MDMINLQGKTNLFEKRGIGEYQKAGVLNQESNTTFSLDSSFKPFIITDICMK